MAVKKQAPAILLITLIFSAPQSQAFTSGSDQQSSVHDQIINDALANKLTPINLSLIEKGCDSQDKPGSDAVSDAKRHFDDEKFGKSFAYMDHQKKLALDYAGSADTSELDRARALYHLGLLLHTAQDFYSETDYLEETIERNRAAGKLTGPYDIQLVDWTQLAKNPAGLSTSKAISKANATTPEGKKALVDATYFQSARELAVKETLRQWQLFETLIKVRYPQRSNSILAALRHASCAADLNVEKLAEDVP